MNKKINRLKRAKLTRIKLKRQNALRLVIYRSIKHIYAQIIDTNGNVLTSTSTLSNKKYLQEKNINTSTKNAARLIGNLIAQQALKLGIKNISFDRSGYLYHGKIKDLAEGARELGLVF